MNESRMSIYFHSEVLNYCTYNNLKRYKMYTKSFEHSRFLLFFKRKEYEKKTDQWTSLILVTVECLMYQDDKLDT